MLVMLWLTWVLRDLAILVAFAGLLAYALDPLVTRAQQMALPRGRSIPRGAAAGLVILLLGAAAGTALFYTIPPLLQQIGHFVATAPSVLAQLNQQVRAQIEAHGWTHWLGGKEGGGHSPMDSLLGALQSGSTALVGHAVGSLGGLASLALLPLFTHYLLADSARARTAFLGLVPERNAPDAERFLDALDRALRGYVRGQALVCLAMGGTMTLVLWALRFPVALLLGVMVGFGEIIPILGFWIAAAAIALEGYSKSPGLALAGVGAYAVVDYLLTTFVSPRLLGRQVKLHPFFINVSVIGGGTLLGPAGAILALPAAAMAKAVLDEFRPKR